jgi:methyl-accepting chemotaxis protein
VVQANAGAAEETASSAVELQAQVEALNQMVNQLLVVVNGRADTNGHDGRPPAASREAPKVTAPQQRIATAPKVRTKTAVPATARKREIAPETLIPFEEDEEFKDTDTTKA